MKRRRDILVKVKVNAHTRGGTAPCTLREAGLRESALFIYDAYLLLLVGA